MKPLDSYKLLGHKFVVFVLCGIPGVGKSTWCKENYPKLPIVSRDIIRNEMRFTKSVDEKAVLAGALEKKVTAREYYKINKLCREKKSFIIDDTTSHRKYRKVLLATLKEYGAYIIGVNISTSLENSIERRKGQIPEEVIRRLYARHEPLESSEVDELLTFTN